MKPHFKFVACVPTVQGPRGFWECNNLPFGWGFSRLYCDISKPYNQHTYYFADDMANDFETLEEALQSRKLTK